MRLCVWAPCPLLPMNFILAWSILIKLDWGDLAPSIVGDFIRTGDEQTIERVDTPITFLVVVDSIFNATR